MSIRNPDVGSLLFHDALEHAGANSIEAGGVEGSLVKTQDRLLTGRNLGGIAPTAGATNEVKLQPHAGLVFYPGAPVQGMTATVRDCKGKSKDIPSDKVQKPGRHKIGSEPDSWVIWLDQRLVSDLEVGSGDCAVLTVKTHASWDDGSTFDAEGAVSVAK